MKTCKIGENKLKLILKLQQYCVLSDKEIIQKHLFTEIKWYLWLKTAKHQFYTPGG